MYQEEGRMRTKAAATSSVGGGENIRLAKSALFTGAQRFLSKRVHVTPDRPLNLIAEFKRTLDWAVYDTTIFPCYISYLRDG